MAAAAASSQPPRRKPGWMSIPGGPKEPNRTEFFNKLKKLNAEKSGLFDKLKDIRAQFESRGDDEGREMIRRERDELRERLGQVDAKRKKEREMRKAKDAEIAAARKKREELERQMKDLSNDLGAFKELEDIEAAIERVMYKMETGKGTLASERATLKKLHQLEEAKTLILQIQPLAEAIQQADNKEYELQQEYREIHEQIGQLNREFEQYYEKKQEHEKAQKKQGVDRTALLKQQDQIRKEIGRIVDEVKQTRAQYDAQVEAWEKWREEAIAKYNEIREAERKERERAYAEREAQRKLERKRQKAARRLNPYATEIDCCNVLIRYLEDKVHANKRDKEEAEHKKKLAAFDPAASAPSGTVLCKADDEWFQDKSKQKNKQKQQQKQKQDQQESHQEGKGSTADSNKLLRHSIEKYRSFEMVGVTVPVSFKQVAATLETLRTKKAEYESHIKEGEDVPSTDEEEERENEGETVDNSAVEATPQGEGTAAAATE